MPEQNFSSSASDREVPAFLYTEKMTVRNTIETVSHNLSENLSPRRKTEVENASQTAIRFAEKFGLKPEMLDISDLKKEEKVIQLLLIANEWQKANSFSSQQRVMNILRRIYISDVRERMVVSVDKKELFTGLTEPFVQKLFKQIWPESGNDPIGWVKENVAKDGIAIAPLNFTDTGPDCGYFLEKKAYDKMRTARSKRFYPEGITIPQEGYFFTFQDVSTNILVHERLHLHSSGLRVGRLGEGINEGMTELLTEEALIGRPPKDGFSYQEETNLLKHIFKDFPKLRETIEAKYRTNNHKNLISMYQSLIEEFGLSDTLLLFLIHSSAGNFSPKYCDSQGIEYTETAFLRIVMARELLRRPKLERKVLISKRIKTP